MRGSARVSGGREAKSVFGSGDREFSVIAEVPDIVPAMLIRRERMSVMIYREFKGKKLSMLGLGAMRLPLVEGGTDSDIDEAHVKRMVE